MIAIRPLDPAEWREFRDFRLMALAADPGVFAVGHAESVGRPEQYWRETLSGDDRRVFGLFDKARLIGITAAFTWREDPSGETALLAMSFIRADYRGRGLSRILYQARLEWIAAQPKFRRVVTSHRVSNEASRRANQRFGFKRTHHVPRSWPDGAVEDEVFYELALAR